MRKVVLLIVAVALLIGAVPAMTFAHGGGQDPALGGPETDTAGSEGQ